MTSSVSEKLKGLHVVIEPPKRESNHDPSTIALWVQKTLKKFKEEDLFNRSKIALIENFPPECVENYKALQEAIAEKYPDEEYRPLICLNIRGKNRVNSSPADIGMAGGMGPLSDATILEKLLTEMDQNTQNNFSGVMYSMPPPRSFWNQLTSFWEFSSLYKSLREALPCTFLHILSNTGHLGRRAWEEDIVFGRKELGLVYDMTAPVANEILEKAQAGAPVLILGTKRASDNRLYQDLLENRGLQPIVPTGEYEGEEAADYLQKIIDQVKAGHVNEKFPGSKDTYGDKFIEFVGNYATKNKCNSLLFSCTELPMLLHTHREGSGETYFNKLKKRLGENMQYHDSEDIFVKKIQQCNTQLQARQKCFSQDDSAFLLRAAYDRKEKTRQDIEAKLGRLRGSNEPEDQHKINDLRAAIKHLENPTADFRSHLRTVTLGNGSTTRKLLEQTERTVKRVEALNHKFTSYTDVFKNAAAKKLDKIVSLEEKIQTHIDKFTDTDEKSNAKKIVLEATLRYLQNPTSENKSLMSKAQIEQPRYKEAFLSNSKTVYLVDQATALIDGISEETTPSMKR